VYFIIILIAAVAHALFILLHLSLGRFSVIYEQVFQIMQSKNLMFIVPSIKNIQQNSSV